MNEKWNAFNNLFELRKLEFEVSSEFSCMYYIMRRCIIHPPVMRIRRPVILENDVLNTFCRFRDQCYFILNRQTVSEMYLSCLNIHIERASLCLKSPLQDFGQNQLEKICDVALARV